MSKHGLLIGLDRVGNAFFVSIKATGKLTHEDYERMVPILEAALVKVNEPRVKVLFDATEFEGWELRAAWMISNWVLPTALALTRLLFTANTNGRIWRPK